MRSIPTMAPAGRSPTGVVLEDALDGELLRPGTPTRPVFTD
jgi:hypothetical protein